MIYVISAVWVCLTFEAAVLHLNNTIAFIC